MITGASTGIGYACALHLDRIGFRVFAGVRRDEDAERLRSAASERLTPVTLDVTDAESIRAAASQVESDLGAEPLVGLVNNAGIAVSGPVEFLPIAEIRKQLEVNFIGQVAVTQAFLARLRRDRLFGPRSNRPDAPLCAGVTPEGRGPDPPASGGTPRS